jgi:acetyl-CoA C-acetyltransferase
METAVILEGARTPIGRFLGSFSELPAVELGALAATEAMRRADVEPAQIDQTIFGHARQAGNGPNTGRQVSIRAGVPKEVSAYNVNIACGSGMKAVQLGAQQIGLGDSEVVLAGGMENMTRAVHPRPMRTGYRMATRRSTTDVPRRPARPLRPDMGDGREPVDMYDISRAEQDGFALSPNTRPRR